MQAKLIRISGREYIMDGKRKTAMSLTYPKRLWNIENNKIEDNEQQHPYVAVTHVWSLMEKSIKDDKKFVDIIRELPKYTKIRQQIKDVKGRIRYAWIDTLCIDQQSSADVTTTIPLMKSYYRNAEFTLVIYPFEKFDENCDAAMYLHRDVWGKNKISLDVIYGHGTTNRIREMWDDPSNDRFRRSVCLFACNEWFKRTWTFQESAFSTKLEGGILEANLYAIHDGKKANILSGMAVVSVCNIIWSAFGLNISIINPEWVGQYYEYNDRSHYLDVRAYCIRFALGSMLSTRKTIPSSYVGVLYRESTIPEDAIFGVMSILEELYPRPTVCYNRPNNFQTVFDDLVDCSIKAGDDYFLYINTNYKHVEGQRYRPEMNKYTMHRLPIQGIFGNVSMTTQDDGLRIKIQSKYSVTICKEFCSEMISEMENIDIIISALEGIVVKYECDKNKSFEWAREANKDTYLPVIQWLVSTNYGKSIYAAVIRQDDTNVIIFLYGEQGEIDTENTIYVITTYKPTTYRVGCSNDYNGAHYGILVKNNSHDKLRRIGYSVSSELKSNCNEEYVLE